MSALSRVIRFQLNRFVTILIVCSLTLAIVACSKSPTPTYETNLDSVDLYYITDESREIMDDGVMKFSILCNYYSAVDNSELQINLVDPLGNVVCSYKETFVSGKRYDKILTSSDLGLDRFVGGEYVISVSNSYNGYEGNSVISVREYPENTILPGDEDIIGTFDSGSWVNEYFGVQISFPATFDVYDASLYYDVDAMGGYYPECEANTADYSFYMISLVGHMYYEKEVELEDLAMYNSYTVLEANSTEVVNINGIDYLAMYYDYMTIYMTNKDYDILLIAMEYDNPENKLIGTITDSIMPID